MSHKTPEDMIAEGHEFATFEDLEGLDEQTLFDIAGLCKDDAEPDACVPCRAFAILMERGEQKVHEDAEADHREALDEWHQEEAEKEAYAFQETLVDKEPAPLAQQFAAKVRELDDMVALLLSGPPIPPPNVTMDELAALVVGAERWLKIIDAQGVELSIHQERIKDHIASVIAKVRRG